MGGWGELEAAEKRARLLRVSYRVFSREGLDLPMSALADAVGIGVGSLYRQFPSKRELVAALVVDRLGEVWRTAEEAAAGDGGAWPALRGLMAEICASQIADDVLAEAISLTDVDPQVRRARRRVTDALRRLVDAAKAEGGLRADATVLDVRLIFAAARAAEEVRAGAWRRALELGIDSLAAGCQADPGERRGGRIDVDGSLR